MIHPVGHLLIFNSHVSRPPLTAASLLLGAGGGGGRLTRGTASPLIPPHPPSSPLKSTTGFIVISMLVWHIEKWKEKEGFPFFQPYIRSTAPTHTQPVPYTHNTHTCSVHIFSDLLRCSLCISRDVRWEISDNASLQPARLGDNQIQ